MQTPALLTIGWGLARDRRPPDHAQGSILGGSLVWQSHNARAPLLLLAAALIPLGLPIALGIDIEGGSLAAALFFLILGVLLLRSGFRTSAQ